VLDRNTGVQSSIGHYVAVVFGKVTKSKVRVV